MFAISFAQYQFRTMGRILKSISNLDSIPSNIFSKRVAGA